MNQVSIYELAVLYYVEKEDNLKKISQSVKKLITTEGGNLLKEDIWGKRQLAYPIKKQTEAIYVFYDLELKPQSIAKLRGQFNINQDILRYQFYKPDLKALKIALDNPAIGLVIPKTEEMEQKSEQKVEAKVGENESQS